jgi:uncharacterized membrane protein
MNTEDSMNDPVQDNVKSQTFNGLRCAYWALGIPFGMLVLSWFVPFLRPRWDSSIIPLLCFAGGMIPAIMAIILSIIAIRQQRSVPAWTGLFLGILALPFCVAIALWLAMQGIASHPV